MSTQYPNGAYKLALLDRWVIIANGRRMTEDIRKAPDTHLSMKEVTAEVCFIRLISRGVVFVPAPEGNARKCRST